ncbi:MAG: outer membrane lipid asymmetry maintenance protein MlaD [Candidatus Eutrophobiaceae bacterium]
MRSNLELLVGFFILSGIIAISVLTFHMGNVSLFDTNQYTVNARFVSVSGLNEGAWVEMAGVRIGRVNSIEYEPENYQALLKLNLEKTVRVPEDSIASVRTSGIIGDKFVKITPGGAEDYLENDMEIFDTEPSISLEELISKYIFESKD